MQNREQRMLMKDVVLDLDGTVFDEELPLASHGNMGRAGEQAYNIYCGVIAAYEALWTRLDESEQGLLRELEEFDQQKQQQNRERTFRSRLARKMLRIPGFRKWYYRTLIVSVRVSEDVLHELRALKEEGVKFYGATSTPFRIRSRLLEKKHPEIFEPHSIITTYEVGKTKRNPEFFEQLKKRFDFREGVQFFDDIQGNVEAAMQAGMQAARVSRDKPLKAFLQELRRMQKESEEQDVTSSLSTPSVAL